MTDPCDGCPGTLPDVCKAYKQGLQSISSWMADANTRLAGCLDSIAPGCLDKLPSTPVLPLPCGTIASVDDLRLALLNAAQSMNSWAMSVNVFGMCVNETLTGCAGSSSLSIEAVRNAASALAQCATDAPSPGQSLGQVCKWFCRVGSTFADWGEALGIWSEQVARCKNLNCLRSDVAHGWFAGSFGGPPWVGGGITRPPWPPWGTSQAQGTLGGLHAIAGAIVAVLERIETRSLGRGPDVVRVFPDGIFRVHVDVKAAGVGEVEIEIDGKRT